VARFAQLGVLDRLDARHEVPRVDYRVLGLGHEIAGGFTPIEGFDKCIGPRRGALDKAIVDTALDAGAEGRFGERVVDLIGAGTADDPVSGVVLENGDRVKARWVFGADGRGSTVAGKLGLEKERPQQGEIAFLFGYWKGIPDNGYMTLAVSEEVVGNRWAIEDGLHILIAGGPSDLTRGTGEERRRKYVETLARQPELIEPEILERAELVTDITVAPESLMRGFFRKPTGPGHSTSTTRGATIAPPSTTTGPSPGGASRAPRGPVSCSRPGRRSRTPARTCATYSAAGSSRPS
jgi:hypothetical protein